MAVPGWSWYLLDDGAQLKAEALAELAQVGEAAGPQCAVGVPRTPQEGLDQRLPVLEHHVPCKREQSGMSQARKNPQRLPAKVPVLSGAAGPDVPPPQSLQHH